ncbi:MAG: S8 family serine peptidase, partial [Acidobacteria bacterium]|nr:S8 family serine peptidase [Acidobacteriota bacterium]
MTTVSGVESGLLERGARFLHLADDWRSATGRAVRVAIVDSGIDASHPDLAGRVIESVEARVDNKRIVFDPSESGDSAGHGTACAGIIA